MDDRGGRRLKIRDGTPEIDTRASSGASASQAVPSRSRDRPKKPSQHVSQTQPPQCELEPYGRLAANTDSLIWKIEMATGMSYKTPQYESSDAANRLFSKNAVFSQGACFIRELVKLGQKDSLEAKEDYQRSRDRMAFIQRDCGDSLGALVATYTTPPELGRMEYDHQRIQTWWKEFKLHPVLKEILLEGSNLF